jgi:hypothetical protein
LTAAAGIASVVIVAATAPVSVPALAISAATGLAVGSAHLGIVSGIVSSSLHFAGK